MLSLVLWTPFAGLLILVCLPASQPRLVRLWANIASLLGLLTCLPLIAQLPPGGGWALREQLPWIPSLGAQYLLAVDGYSLLLVLLTALLSMLATLSSWRLETKRLKEYYACLLLLQWATTGVFLALDLLLFFFFFELVLVPMYFLIAGWGGPQRQYAATKFLIYTLVGSLLLLVGIIMLAHQHQALTGVQTFDYFLLRRTTLPAATQTSLFLLFLAGFAVKIPMWPLHTWLPDAHVEAPTAGSVLLAGVLLKMGTYGLLRFAVPLFPAAIREPAMVYALGALSIVAIVYASVICLRQQDAKKLVAYSSVSHLGFATLGIFSLQPLGLLGSILEQINHGISTSLLFLLVGMMYERRHTRLLAEFGGLFRVVPALSLVLLLAVLSSMGAPPLNGFLGELLVVQGSARMSLNWAVWAALGIVLGAAYLLYLFQRVALGELAEANAGLRDLSPREWLIVSPLLIAIVLLGVFPQPVLSLLTDPVRDLLTRP